MQFFNQEEELAKTIAKLEQADLTYVKLFLGALEEFSLFDATDESAYDEALEILCVPELRSLIDWPEGKPASKEAAFCAGLSFLSMGVGNRSKLMPQEAATIIRLLKLPVS